MNEILEQVREALPAEGLDALVVSCAVEDSFGHHGANRRYVSGFSGSTGLVLVTGDAAILAVDSRYAEQAASESPGFQIWPTPRERQRRWFPRLLSDAALAGKRVGVSPDDMSVSEYVVVQEAAQSFDAGARPDIVAAPRLIERLRARKTAAERARIQKAVAVADRAYENILPAVVAGANERELASEIEEAVRAEGGEGLSFETIVAAGPWGAQVAAEFGTPIP
ncbi:MAG: M24 family metallopeptidase, partial [Dehalococcoidia bacterium]